MRVISARFAAWLAWSKYLWRRLGERCDFGDRRSHQQAKVELYSCHFGPLAH